MLTAEIGLLPDGSVSKEVELYFDRQGLDLLLEKLSRLRDGKTDHYHLMTSSWGLGDLSEEKQGNNTTLAQHLKITFRG